MWTQIDAGVVFALGAIVETAAIRKLQRPRVFALTLARLEPGLAGKRRKEIPLALAVAGYEATVGAGVVAFRGTVGFVFACALLVVCAGFLVALARAVRQSVPCACFGRLGKTAAGGREIGRGVVLVGAAALLVVHRAVSAGSGYGFGVIAVVAVVVTALVIVAGQFVGGRIRPGEEIMPAPTAGQASLARSLRRLTGYDNDLYTTER